MDFDLIIRNGALLDGTGRTARQDDIGISGDRIAEIGNLGAAAAAEIIDATDCIVCPGFIDAHSHSDAYLLIEPSAASKTHQGVTTEICGNCGASAAPLSGEYTMPSDWMAQRYPKPWKTIADYRERLHEAQPAVNTALLVGHNTLHAGICGYEPRGGTPEELNRMQSALEQALDEGAIGLSSGLIYPPGSAVPREEIIELAKTVAAHNGLYTTHMRSETKGLLNAVDEAIDIAARSGARLQISHLKTGTQSVWDQLSQVFEKIETAQQTIEVGADRYPYLASCTDLDIVLPSWASHGGRDAILARLHEHSTRRKIRDELNKHPDGYWDNVMIGSTSFAQFKGEYLSTVAETLGMDEVDALLHLIDTDNLTTGGIFFGMSEKNMWKILAKPYVSLGSDASLRAPWGPLSNDHPHPRAYGSFTKFLRAALDGNTVSLPEAVRKMTALPAKQFGLNKRGQLKKGYYADIAVFRPEDIQENTGYKDPHRLSGGIQHLFVNGCCTLKGGKTTSRHAGYFLHK